MPKFIPTHSTNVPYGGIQQPVHISNNDPVYSSYTGKKIGYGPIQYGVPTDAVKGQSGYGKNYHVIVFNSANGKWMAHNYCNE